MLAHLYNLVYCIYSVVSYFKFQRWLLTDVSEFFKKKSLDETFTLTMTCIPEITNFAVYHCRQLVFLLWHNVGSPTGMDSQHEIACLQVHGQDINCVTIIQAKGNHRFVSRADEKVARLFEPPLSFLKTLNHATSLNSSFPEDLQVDIQILDANMYALRLSQKPIYVNGKSLFLSHSSRKINVAD